MPRLTGEASIGLGLVVKSADRDELVARYLKLAGLQNFKGAYPIQLSGGMEEANDCTVSGCSEIRMPNRDTYTSPCACINFAAAL